MRKATASCIGICGRGKWRKTVNFLNLFAEGFLHTSQVAAALDHGEHRSLRTIAAEMASLGHVNPRSGQAYSATALMHALRPSPRAQAPSKAAIPTETS